MSKHQDITGQKFSYLTALRRVGSGMLGTLWECLCDCGATKTVAVGQLRAKRITSCGCMTLKIRSENGKKRVKHGCAGTSIHNTWMAMIERCHNPYSECYTNYGHRGISVCTRWRNHFIYFLEDMGHKPTPAHTIERRDNNGNYCPENCYWATRKEQSRNNRRTKWLTLGSKTMCMQDWSNLLGISRPMLTQRKKRGWPDEAALLVPTKMAQEMSHFLSSIDRQLSARERIAY